MTYIDGYVLPIPDRNETAYLKMARVAAKIWADHGALFYFESKGDDVPVGKLTSFTRAVQLKKGETAWFSFVGYKSRKDRDAVMAKVMQDPRMQPYMTPGAMPLDGKRMIFGGFKTMIEIGAPGAKPAKKAAKTPARRKAAKKKSARRPARG
jgi:uncharacterized protein YbaA (DUF1428 family)